MCVVWCGVWAVWAVSPDTGRNENQWWQHTSKTLLNGTQMMMIIMIMNLFCVYENYYENVGSAVQSVRSDAEYFPKISQLLHCVTFDMKTLKMLVF
jgi:hypothetical protein